MNNKKLICLFIAIPLLSIDADQCRDYFEEIKKGAPYEIREATISAGKIWTRENQIAENPFVDVYIKKEAQRRALCANTFLHYGAYYTSQMQFIEFDEKFKRTQKLNPEILREDFLNQYVQEKNADISPKLKFLNPDLTVLRDLQQQAKQRSNFFMSLPEEKETGKAWLPIIDKALEQKAVSQPTAVQDSSEDIEKYLK